MNERGKLLVFHHSDLDGMGVKLLGMLYGVMKGYGIEDIETFKCNYGDIDSIIENRLDNDPHMVTEIIIGDISVQSQHTAEVLDNFYTKIPVSLYDHHATATWLNKYFWAKVREKDEDGIERCGTYWVAKEMFNPVFLADNEYVKYFIELVDLYDTWKWMNLDPSNPVVEADNLNSVFKMMGEKDFTDFIFPRLIQNEPFFDDTTKMIVSIRNRQLDNKAFKLNKDMRIGQFVFDTSGHPEMIDDLKKFYEETYADDEARTHYALTHFKEGYKKVFNVGVVFENNDLSDLGNRLLELHPELDFVIFTCLPGLMSYRSKKNLAVPLGIIAKYATGRGGGHPQSAGGSIKPSSLNKVMKEILPDLSL